MPIPVSRLRVHPNPYVGSDHDGSSIDHLGRPAGRVPYDPYEDSPRMPPDIGVGAKFANIRETHAAKSMRFGKRSVEHQAARFDHRIAYSKVAVELPNTGYYRDAVKSGHLFAADKKTWVASGGAAKDFVEPTVALAKAKADAIKHFDNATGEDAHKEMGAHEPLWFGGDEPAAPTATTALPAAAASAAPTPPKPADAVKDSSK